MPLIDVHAHYFSREYIDLLERAGASGEVIEPSRMVLKDSPERELVERLEHMDQGDVELQVLSMSGATPYLESESAALAAAQFSNDEHARLCAEYPARFRFFASLPMPHIDASLQELRRAYDVLGAAGVTFTTSINGRSLADERFAPVFEELDRRAAVVFLHPPGFACQSTSIRESGMTWPLGAPVEDALCALQLMKAEFPRRYPRLKIILPHLGGFLPFLINRLDRTASHFMPDADLPSVQVRKFWYDSVNGDPDALAHSVKCYGSDRVLFGTDFPYWKGAGHQHAIDYLGLAGLSPADLDAIRQGNARSLLRLEPHDS